MSDREPEAEEQETPKGRGEIVSGGSKEGSLFERLAPSNLDWRTLVLVPLLAVVSALILGALVILITDGPDAVGAAYAALFRGAFVGWGSISETLTSSAPLILAGLSVAVGFQAGLFNIGAEGQMVVGGLAAVVIGFSITGLPMIVHLPLALLGGFLAGAVWGGIPGWLKARTGAHEVITTIMLNFIAFNLLNYLLKVPFIQLEGRFDPISKTVESTARLPRILTWLPVPGLRLHLGIIVALLAAWGVWWLLYRSSVGFEFRAVGANPDAAKYGGMAVGWSLFLVMAVAGGLGGVAGSNETLGVLGNASPGFTSNIGFDAIALALLGRSHPGGVVLAGLLFGALRAGGRTMQAQSDVGIDLITIVQALVIVFIAAPALVRAIYRVRGGKGAGQITRGWA